MRNVLLGLAATVAFAINPAFIGCSETRYSFGVEEMSAAIAGAWTLTSSGTTYTFTLSPKRADVQGRAEAGFFTDAAACGNRTLVASAHACADTTTLPLIIAFADGSKHEATARLVVVGPAFIEGSLYLTIDDLALIASITADGSVKRMPEAGTLVHAR